jgi:hypothetical protein
MLSWVANIVPFWGHFCLKKRKENQCWAIRCEFEHVDPTLLKNPLRVLWGVLHTLRLMGSWLPTYLVFSVKQREDFITWIELPTTPLLTLGTSPLSPGSLGSSRTISSSTLNHDFNNEVHCLLGTWIWLAENGSYKTWLNLEEILSWKFRLRNLILFQDCGHTRLLRAPVSLSPAMHW